MTCVFDTLTLSSPIIVNGKMKPPDSYYNGMKKALKYKLTMGDMKSVSLCDDSNVLVPRMENWCNPLPKLFV